MLVKTLRISKILMDSSPENPYDLIPESGWTAIAYAGSFAAGFGDTVTLGGTRYVRRLNGADDVVDPCSWDYFSGDVAGTIVLMLMGQER